MKNPVNNPQAVASLYRQIPSVDELMGRPRLAELVRTAGRGLVLNATRNVLEGVRAAIQHKPEAMEGALDAARIEEQVVDEVRRALEASLRPVINATGVVLHTNLGRAPLVTAAIEHLRQTATQYSNLEYDLDARARGKRDVHTARLLTSLLGAEAAVVVNNCAAAVFLVLNTLAKGAEVIVSRGELIEIGGEGHSLTDSRDQWIIGTNENTAASLLLHEDYRDYYGREGFSVHTGYYTRQDFITAQLSVAYVLDKYTSLEKRTEWSIFGGRKVFRPNPVIDDGRMRSIVVTPGFSTETRTSRGQEGWTIYGTAEFADERYGGDFNFSQAIADIRRYQPLSWYDNFNIRLRVGTSGGKIPAQKTFELGGLSSLHARPYKSETGNRMILVNAEYIVNGDFLRDLDFWPSGLLRHFNFIVLSDAGLMRSAPSEEGWMKGFEDIRFSEFKHDLGVGLSNRSGSFRIGFVWRTDVKSPGRLFFRFERPF